MVLQTDAIISSVHESVPGRRRAADVVPRVEPLASNLARTVPYLYIHDGALGNPLRAAAAHDPPPPVLESLGLDYHSSSSSSNSSTVHAAASSCCCLYCCC